jgi:hypothetical protein
LDAHCPRESATDSTEPVDLQALAEEIAQGYLFSRPIPAEKITALLDEHLPPDAIDAGPEPRPSSLASLPGD